MTRCSNCDAAVPSEATACPQCGATFVEESTAESTGGSVWGRLSVRSAALGVAVLAAGLLFIQLLIPLAFGFSPIRPPWVRLLFAALWGIGAVGLWADTPRGLALGAGVFAVSAAVSGAVVLQVPAWNRLLAGVVTVDPISQLTRTIYRLQAAAQSRGRVPAAVRRGSAVAGTVLTGGLAVVLWRVRQHRLRARSTAANAEATLGGRSSRGLVLLATSVTFVLVVGLAGLAGFPASSPTARALIAGFPSVMAIVAVALEITRPDTIASSINLPLVVVFGSVIPLSLVLDMRRMWRRTEWHPNRVLYPLGAVLLWFLTLAVYVYRRRTAVGAADGQSPSS